MLWFYPVVIYGCESWTIKKAEHWRIDDFKLLCWRRLLRVPPLDSKEIKPVNPKGNQPWIFIGKTDAEAEAPVFWILIQEQTNWNRPWSWKRLKVKKTGGSIGWDGWMVSLTQWTGIEQLWEIVKDRGAWSAPVRGVAKSGTWLIDWAETIGIISIILLLPDPLTLLFVSLTMI